MPVNSFIFFIFNIAVFFGGLELGIGIGLDCILCIWWYNNQSMSCPVPLCITKKKFYYIKSDLDYVLKTNQFFLHLQCAVFFIALWNAIITIIKYQSKSYRAQYAKISVFFADFFNSKGTLHTFLASFIQFGNCAFLRTVIWDINYLFRSVSISKYSISVEFNTRHCNWPITLLIFQISANPHTHGKQQSIIRTVPLQNEFNWNYSW